MNKSSAEAVPLVCLDPNITKKLMPSARRNSKGSAASGAMGFTESPNALFSGGVLQPSSPNRQLIRTLKFVKKFNSKGNVF